MLVVLLSGRAAGWLFGVIWLLVVGRWLINVGIFQTKPNKASAGCGVVGCPLAGANVDTGWLCGF